MSIDGSLLGRRQQAKLTLSALPLDVFQPLVQAALPQLSADRPATASHAPIAKPLATLQRQLKRSAEAFAMPYGPIGPVGAAAEASDVPPAPIRGLLSIEGSLTGSVDVPEGDMRVKVDHAVLGSLKLSEASARAQLGADGMANVHGTMIPHGTPGRIDATCSMRAADGERFAAHCTVKDGGMLILSELAGGDARWLDGRATVHTAATGTLKAPVLTVDAQLARGRISVPHLKEPLRAISGRLKFENDAIAVTNLHASNGKSGVLKLGGRLPLRAMTGPELEQPEDDTSSRVSHASNSTVRFTARSLSMPCLDAAHL